MPLITITNPLPIEVDIYEVYNPTDDLHHPFTYAWLGTISGQATGTVSTSRPASELQAMRTGRIAALGGTYYEQFPVAVLAGSSASNAAFTLSADAQQGMEQALRFIQYTQANASSRTAQDFRQALVSAPDAEAAVNAFFAGTGSFQQCTLASWTAVLSWQTQFTSAWQGTYYLYATAADAAPRLLATLAIGPVAGPGAALLTPADPGSPPLALAPATDGTLTALPGGPAVAALTPVWMNVLQTNSPAGQPAASYLIGAGLGGTLDGHPVVGYSQPLTPVAPPAAAGRPVGRQLRATSTRMLADSQGGGSGSSGSQSGSQGSGDQGSSTLVISLVASVSAAVSALAAVGAAIVAIMQYRANRAQLQAELANTTEINRLKDQLNNLDAVQRPLLEQRVTDLKAQVDGLPDLYINVAGTRTNQETYTALQKQVTDLNNQLSLTAPNARVEDLMQNLSDLQREVKAGHVNVAKKLQDLADQAKTVLSEEKASLTQGLTNQLTQTEQTTRELATQTDLVVRTTEQLQKQQDQNPDGDVTVKVEPEKSAEPPIND